MIDYIVILFQYFVQEIDGWNSVKVNEEKMRSSIWYHCDSYLVIKNKKIKGPYKTEN